jgi:large subunit ribosomal protein L3
MGGKRVTTQNLKVFLINAEKGIIILSGSVPGYTGCVVTMQSAVKKHLK